VKRFLYSIFCLVLFGVVSASGVDRDVQFQEANRAFEGGKFDAAIETYEKLVESGESSADLYYNLATANYRAGKTGESVLWLRRASLLDSTLPEVRQNLEFLRSRVAFLEFADSGWLRFLGGLPKSFFPWAVSLLFWLGLILGILGFCLPNFRNFRSWGITLAIIFLMLAFVINRLGNYRQSRIAPQNFATIIASGVSAVTSPTPTAKPVIELPPGSQLRILQIDKNWVYADIPGELRGWVRAKEVKQNWPVFRNLENQTQNSASSPN
jgi:tetratricopeptide (TPR) repeat protein